MTAIQAIRAKCIECNCGDKLAVKRCDMSDCPLHPYRMGHNPARKGIGGSFSPAQGAQENLQGDE